MLPVRASNSATVWRNEGRGTGNGVYPRGAPPHESNGRGQSIGDARQISFFHCGRLGHLARECMGTFPIISAGTMSARSTT